MNRRQRFYFSLLAGLLLSSCASPPKKQIEPAPTLKPAPGVYEVSVDCETWSTSATPPGQGFVRKEGTTLFVDLEKKTYVTLVGKSAPFFFDASNASVTFVATPSGINAIETQSQENLTSISDLVRASERSANETLKTSRWLPIFIGDRTKLVAAVNGQHCASAPEASFINCETSPLSCSLFPAVDGSLASGTGVVDSCLSELELRSDGKIAPVKRACDYFQSSSYEEKRRVALEKAEFCGVAAVTAVSKLPTLLRVENGCRDLENATLELEKREGERPN